MKDKKDIVIIVLLCIIAGFIAYFVTTSILKSDSSTSSDNSYSIDGSKMSTSELINMFKKENYTFKIQAFSDTTSTKYILLENDSQGITIQRIYNIYVGTLMSFRDSTLNKELADIMYSSNNKTEEEKQQYKAYEKWLEKYNITKVQLSDMLDYYYKNNSDNIEYIDVSQYMN